MLYRDANSAGLGWAKMLEPKDEPKTSPAVI